MNKIRLFMLLLICCLVLGGFSDWDKFMDNLNNSDGTYRPYYKPNTTYRTSPGYNNSNSSSSGCATTPQTHHEITDPVTLFEYGKNYEASNDYETAVLYYTRVIELNPDFLDEVYFRRGYAYSMLDGYNGISIFDLTRAIEMNPENTLAMIRRAYVYNQEGMYTEALDDYKKACDLGDNLGCLNYTKLKEYLSDKGIDPSKSSEETKSNKKNETKKEGLGEFFDGEYEK